MKLEPLTYDDLSAIGHLQPEGWPDIGKDFKFYLDADFCMTVKKVLGNRIVGTGAAIILGDTAWIAHIIVDPEFRNRGIGSTIVEELMNRLKGFSLRSYLLIATEMGRTLYEKAGFRVVSDYIYFRREVPWTDQIISEKVQAFDQTFTTDILELDRKISGEDRSVLLRDHIKSSRIFIRNNSLKGVYIPGPGEGLIIADTKEAGIELMKIKYAMIDKAVLPAGNEDGISFLEQHGFVRTPVKGTRMVYGEEVHWKAHKIFSRIGGNFG
jgi:GNAT superfamily N-acetyltransferase